MRLFQNCRYYRSLRPKFRELAKSYPTFAGRIAAFLDFRSNGVHVLRPVDQKADWAFFTYGDDLELQTLWAREHGLPAKASPEDIIKAQIEHHRADVVYNMDTAGWKSELVRSLPGCVKHVIAWHGSPFGNIVFSDYDLVVSIFPLVLKVLQEQGCRTDYFFPAYDPVLDPYAARQDRPVDVLFVGGYSQLHRQRAPMLEAVAKMADRYNIVFHLDRSRLVRLAESPLGHLLPPLAKHRRPQAIRAITEAPIFGRDYYQALSEAKIVLNGSIDMMGADRGNMRCFEAMGGGSLLLSDEGNYPDGMTDGETIAIYRSADDAVEQIKAYLEAPQRRLDVAQRGHEMVSTRYSKQVQWKRFEELVASL